MNSSFVPGLFTVPVKRRSAFLNAAAAAFRAEKPSRERDQGLSDSKLPRRLISIRSAAHVAGAGIYSEETEVSPNPFLNQYSERRRI